jgi:hypothetical protein
MFLESHPSKYDFPYLIFAIHYQLSPSNINIKGVCFWGGGGVLCVEPTEKAKKSNKK